MVRHLNGLERLLRFRRQAARLADAACLRARGALDVAQREFDSWNRRLQELARQSMCITNAVDACGQLRVSQDLAAEIDRSRTAALEQTQQLHRVFLEAAEACRRRRQEVEILEKLLESRRFEARVQEERSAARQLEDRILQSWQSKSDAREPVNTPLPSTGNRFRSQSSEPSHRPPEQESWAE